jgi:DNA-binding LacI/PurR family transcriptional regulator
MIKPLQGAARKGYLETQALLTLPAAQRPTAIFAVSDKTALGALEALKGAGIRVPEDMSLVGFDDIAECTQSVPTLTTIRNPLEDIGQMAARRLIIGIEGEGATLHKILLPTELVVRQSSDVHASTRPATLPAVASV